MSRTQLAPTDSLFEVPVQSLASLFRPAMQRLSLIIRRVLVHLTRSKARVAWVLIVLCSVLYASVSEETVRQMTLVLASVAAAAIFLPELSSDLWNMHSDEIQKTVPEKQVEKLQK